MDKKFTQKLVVGDIDRSLADLFTGTVHGSASTTASFSEDVESSEFLQVYEELENRFIPQVDFSSASNFAKFGSARKYYEDSFTRIYNQYPYDGSQREKVLWELSSSYLDKYIFENVYPRTNGFININSSSHTYTTTKATGGYYSSSAPEFVLFYGGPHADPYGNYRIDLESGKSTAGISKANVYHTASDRGNNLEINLDKGLTIEFWMKKRGWVTAPDAGVAREVMFANFTTGSAVTDSWCILYADNDDKGVLGLVISSGSADGAHAITQATFDFTTGLSDIGDGDWRHYAVTAKTIGSDTVASLYIDGVHISEETDSDTLNPVTGAMNAAIGAFPSKMNFNSTAFYGPGYSNIVSSSFDEFRYWKTARTRKQIGRYYIDQINGGTNTDKANVALGVYYKFNEGITLTSSTDAAVLDYSGRISNGVIVNYNSTVLLEKPGYSRATGSAIVLSGKATREFQDPIIHVNHPDVRSTLASLQIKGDMHDFENANSFINSIPSWIVENDATEGNEHLSKLVQVLGSYLDSLYLQIEALPTLKNINYASSSAKPHFFNRHLLKDYGFDVEEILTNVDLFAYGNTRDDERLFEKKLYDVKNQIYKNIYNNLVYIYKTKGTKKAFRNLLRCVGIDEELVRLNLYGLNTDWQLKESNRDVFSKTKYVDFYNHNEAVVYGYPEAGNTNSKSFISGSGPSNDVYNGIDTYGAVTIEADVVFPKYPLNKSIHAKDYIYFSSSLFGMHGVKDPATATDMTWPDSPLDVSASVQVYAIRKQKQGLENNPEVSFLLSGSILGTSLESPVYTNVYQNSKWKFAVKFSQARQFQGLDYVSGSLGTGADTRTLNVEFFGTQVIGDSVLQSFSTSGNLIDYGIGGDPAAVKYGPFIAPKRLYCGANRTDFTEAVLTRSDVFISNLRYWNSYLTDECLTYHAKNDVSYGTMDPYRNTYLFEGNGLGTTGLSKNEMPQIASLALNWNFDQVTGSDSSGRFTVADFSSGSNSSNNYKLSNIVERQHTGRGDFFLANSSEVVERKLMPSSRLTPFDQVNSDDMVEIVDFEGELFTRESRPVEYFFALEKSMYANISDDMLNMFATIKDFHNLIGEPVNRYRKDYKDMGKLREFFFRRVNNIPDLDKFVEYYKWIDNSISTMLMNLVPATANFSKNIRTMVENHALTRNVIETKYPVLELNQPEPDGRIKAVNELLYDWKHGHSPLSNVQDDNCLYWKDRAERTGSVITSGDVNVDQQRNTIKRFANSVVSGSTYVLRKLTRPYRFVVDRSEDFEIDGAKLNYVKAELNPSSKTNSIILQNIESVKDCNDNSALRTKTKLDFQASVNADILKGRSIAPFTIFSSSFSTGYKVALSTFSAGSEINDNHRDVYGTETQESLQGPFSKIHVGGKKSRKVAPFTSPGPDGGGANLRPEEYDITVSSDNITLSPRSLTDAQSKYFLDEIAKRPVVIRNIKTSTGSLYLGNYSKEYQIVQTVGANTQRGWLKDNFTNFSQSTAAVLNIASAKSATGWIEITTNDPAHLDGKYFEIISTDETLRRYHYDDDNDGATGTVKAAGPPKEIYVQINGLSARADFEEQLKNAILSLEGHAGKIEASLDNSRVELRQLLPGIAGNTVLTDTVGAAHENKSYPGFAGGVGSFSDSLGIRTGSSLQSVTIADRFSAPGGPETMSPDYLDPTSHTFSVYNGINYRNITVRLPRTNIQHSGADASKYYKYRPFGAPGISETGSLRVLQTDAPLNVRMRNPMCGPYTGYGGYDMKLLSADEIPVTASIHKVNRNKINVAKTTNAAGDENVVYTPRFDNGFVQHPIPRSDRQYSWITASLSGSGNGGAFDTLGFAIGNGDGLAGPTGYSVKSNDMTFISDGPGSWGTGISRGLNVAKLGPGDPATSDQYLATDFAGLNFNVLDAVSASNNQLGFYGSDGIIPLLDSYGQWTYDQGTARVWSNYGAGPAPLIRHFGPDLFNALILHRQGPYGWPSWKQIRGGNHPIMRNHRLTNTFSTIDGTAPKPNIAAGSIQSNYEWPDNIAPGEASTDGMRTIINLTESVVTINYKPMSIEVQLPAGQSSKIKFTYANETAYFANKEIFGYILLYGAGGDIYEKSRSRSEAYKAITKLYLNSDGPIVGLKSLKFSQVVWPRTKNTFLNKTRARNNYTEEAGVASNGYDRIKHRTFWRDRAEDRLRTDLTALDSQGNILSASNYNINNYDNASWEGDPLLAASASKGAPLSVWPLDGGFTGSYTTLSQSNPESLNETAGNLTVIVPALGFLNNTDKFAGELFGGQQSYLTYVNYAFLTLTAVNQWMTASCRYHGTDMHMGGYAPPAETILPTSLDLAPHSCSSNVYWTTNIDSGRNPWYDSYEDYSADLSKIGKDYSIIPEFNISDHMEYYVTQKQSDFMAPLPIDKFIIQGIIGSASAAPTADPIAAASSFYEEYSHSDFLKNFDLVVEDHGGENPVGAIKRVNMICYGLKKLLPYNGFYPVTRTLQMATLLSQSIGSQISGSYGPWDASWSADGYGPTEPQSGFSAQEVYTTPEISAHASMMQPLFAPGILYNTIKSGIAVDWPTYTGSSPDTAYFELFRMACMTSASNYRLPFEALYELNQIPKFQSETLTPSKKIYSVSNHSSPSFFTWTGNTNHDLYERAMNNFLAESVNLFLHDSKLTSFVSKPVSEVEFKEGFTYYMSVDLEKTADCIMTEGAIGSQTALILSGNAPGDQQDGDVFNWRAFINRRGVIYGPATQWFTESVAALLDVMHCGEAQDPAYAPYTPPYFYGKATVDLEYTNIAMDTISPSLGTVFSSVTASYSNNLNNIPTASYDLGNHYGNFETPLRFFVRSGTPAIDTMMQISSSLNLFGKTANPLATMNQFGQTLSLMQPEDPSNQERWVISTKYECPVLNFNHYTDDSKARGMWNGYGNIPDVSEGIKITLRETDPTILNIPGRPIGSLLQKFFPNNIENTKPVGQLPIDYEKSISECIVAIPFLPGHGGPKGLPLANLYGCHYSSDDDKYFFPIDMNEAPGPSILNLQNKMRKFVFPPRYDFVNNPNPAISPFVMFAFEFTHKFTRQELADIWQGVMPDISMKVVPETTTLGIPAKSGELMNAAFAKLMEASSSPLKNYKVKQAIKNLRWMVFKVKQRARNIYANITEDVTDNIKTAAVIQQEGPELSIGGPSIGAGTNLLAVDPTIVANDHTYSYNWPYDYCSLVELAKFDMGVEIGPPVDVALHQLDAESMAAILSSTTEEEEEEEAGTPTTETAIVDLFTGYEEEGTDY